MATEPSSTNGNGKMYQVSLFHLVLTALATVGSVAAFAGTLAWNHSINLQLLSARVMVNEKRLDYIYQLADKRGDEDGARDKELARMRQEIADLRGRIEDERRRNGNGR